MNRHVLCFALALLFCGCNSIDVTAVPRIENACLNEGITAEEVNFVYDVIVDARQGGLSRLEVVTAYQPNCEATGSYDDCIICINEIANYVYGR